MRRKMYNIFQKLLQAPPFWLFGCVRLLFFFSFLPCVWASHNVQGRDRQRERVSLNRCWMLYWMYYYYYYVCSARIKSFPIQANGCVKRGSAFPHQKTYNSMHTRLYLCVRLVLHQVPGYTNTLVLSAFAVDVYKRERLYFVFARIFREANRIS